MRFKRSIARLWILFLISSLSLLIVMMVKTNPLFVNPLFVSVLAITISFVVVAHILTFITMWAMDNW